jgi:hypothetical protein
MAGNRRQMVIIPPGGFAGFAQQTAATHALLSPRKSRGTANGRPRRKKKRVAKKRAAPKRARRAATGKTSRMVKGSAAAKRHMAKLRKMRRR